MQTTVLQNLEVRCRKFTEQLTDITNELETMQQVVHRQQSCNLITPQATLVGKLIYIILHYKRILST